MECLVTGGAGFIGSHLVDKLISQGYRVTVLDDLSLGTEGNLEQHFKKKSFSFFRRNICNNLSDIFIKRKITTVFHFAALPGAQLSIRHPIKTHQANVNGTLNLLNFCKKFGVRRILFASSATTYGNQDKSLLSEDMKTKPLSPYALHKLTGEYYCQLFYELYKLESISLRYFNVFGPRQSTKGKYTPLIPKFITLLNKGRGLTVNGDGEQTRDFIYVSDVVEATIAAARIEDNSCVGQVLNIGTGKSISVNEVVQSIITLSNKKVRVIYDPPVREIKHSLADISRARTLLRWTPKISFQDGLKQTYEYLNNSA